MKLLLDTHALIWWLPDSPRLTAAARAAIADPGNAPFVSAVSGYERQQGTIGSATWKADCDPAEGIAKGTHLRPCPDP